jgi:hypothetical protein
MIKNTSALLLAALSTGCATVPVGPSIAIMPGIGKSFEQFVAEDRACRAYADQSVGIDVNDAGVGNVVAGAAVGTAIGAAAGALLSGGHNGTAAGAGMGLIVGTAEGAGAAGMAQRDTQRRYDIAYEQCMYAKGNQLPPSSPVTYYRYRYYRQPILIYQSPPAVITQGTPAPPPPGWPPPPPPGRYRTGMTKSSSELP